MFYLLFTFCFLEYHTELHETDLMSNDVNALTVLKLTLLNKSNLL